MVTNITSFGRSGLSDWLMQRVSAVILALYTVFVVAYLLFNPNLDYYAWSGLFEQTWMRIFSLLALQCRISSELLPTSTWMVPTANSM